MTIGTIYLATMTTFLEVASVVLVGVIFLLIPIWWTTRVRKPGP